MKLWLISQTTNNGYDTYDSAVVATETEEEAKRMDPGRFFDMRDLCEDSQYHWVSNPDNVNCEYLGEAAEGTKKSVICASFNAG